VIRSSREERQEAILSCSASEVVNTGIFSIAVLLTAGTTPPAYSIKSIFERVF